MKQKVEQAMNEIPALDMAAFQSLSNSVKVDDLVDGLGRAWLNYGDTDRALHLFELSTRRRPWMPNGFVFSAICHFQLGNISEARKSLERSRNTVLSETKPLIEDRNKLERAMSQENRTVGFDGNF